MNPTPEQQVWLSEQMAKVTTPERVNPCIGLFGAGPAGKKCKTCSHLMHQGRRYLKCSFRKNTHGPATDHRAGWTACARYEEA